ncbi:MAG: signal peptidase II [Betaproteobacteria bacterium]|nr:signal peptidase II [Betaproteobacteria bacterium]
MTFKQFLYDWNGLNVTWFGTINQATPDWLAPLAQVGSALGSYWSGPFLLIALLLWSWRLNAAAETQAAAVRIQAQRFALGFALAWLGVAMLKLIVDFPRPVAALPDLVRIIGDPESQFSFPSGHAAYAMLAAASLWPLAAHRVRALLVVWLVWVAWSRIAVGAHFPADVFAGFLIGRLAAWIARFASGTRWVWWCAAGAIALLDQGTKQLVEARLEYAQVIPVTAFFNLVHVWNSGAAFSILADAGGWQRWFFIALATGVSAWLAFALLKPRLQREAAAYCLILGGALGNLADRVFRGYVVDSLDFHWGGWHWPAFNFADVAITLGVGLFLAADSVCRRPGYGAST